MNLPPELTKKKLKTVQATPAEIQRVISNTIFYLTARLGYI